MDFLKKFKEVYGYIPYRVTNKGFNYAYLGYDLIHFFVEGMKKFGPDFDQCIEYFQPDDLLLGNMHFRKAGEGSGFVNEGISIVEYTRDYNIKEAVTGQPADLKNQPSEQKTTDETYRTNEKSFSSH